MNVSRRRYMGEKGGSIPYQRIEYLESTGTQYIDLGYFDGAKAEIETELTLYKSSAEVDVFSNQTDAYNTGRFAFGLYNNYVFAYSPNTGNDGNATLSTFNVGLFSVVKCVFDTTKNSKYFTIDGNTSTTAKCVNISNTQKGLFLFAGNSNLGVVNPYIGKIRYFRIYKDDVIWHELIPVRIGQVGYMYDTISGELFGNLGTGDFVLGPDIN